MFPDAGSVFIVDEIFNSETGHWAKTGNINIAPNVTKAEIKSITEVFFS